MTQAEPWPIKVKWIDGFQFIGYDDGGHSVVMDLPKDKGGGNLGMSPTKLFLASLAGCTAIDVALIMQKQKQDLKELEVLISGEQHAGEFPHYFTGIGLNESNQYHICIGEHCHPQLKSRLLPDCAPLAGDIFRFFVLAILVGAQ